MNLRNILIDLVDVADKYYVVAGVAFLLVYVVLRKRVGWRKIQLRFPADKDYRREIVDSTISIFIFALMPIIILRVPEIRVHTQLYGPIAARGWVYFILVFPVLFVVHDTYFYWMHRIIHHPKLFRPIHLEHHRSVNPSPWAAYAFGPIEAYLESLIFPIFLFTIPVTVWHVFVFFILSIMYNVYGHLGFELYPKGFHRSWVGRWVNTSVSHNQHHHYFKGNYGLYFLWWDRWMGTIRDDYDRAFEEVTGRVKSGVKSGLVTAFLLLAGVAGVRGQVKADDITGVWLTHGDKPAKVQIYKSGGQYFGKIVYLQFPTENGKPMVDKKNPDAGKQDRPLLGLVILTGFQFDTDEWNGGDVYDPEKGKTYSCTISLKDANTLKVRGYIGISLLGRTEIWTRVPN
jgi:sterol desaturase/sphingolipid hydroxylase (fatty acid hydroxylase superfamily)